MHSILCVGSSLLQVSVLLKLLIASHLLFFVTACHNLTIKRFDIFIPTTWFLDLVIFAIFYFLFPLLWS